MRNKTQNTSINKKEILRIPDQDGEFMALNSTATPDLHVEFVPDAPKDRAGFNAWIKAKFKKMNGLK